MKMPPAGTSRRLKEGYKKAFSGLFTELMPALAAGDGHFTNFAGKLQPAFALGAAEVQIFLAVLEAVLRLIYVLTKIAGEREELLVFGIAPGDIFGEQAVERPDIKRQTDIAEQTPSGEDGDDIHCKAGPYLYAGKLVAAVSAGHEPAETFLDLLPHEDASLSFCALMISCEYQLFMNCAIIYKSFCR